MRKGIALISAEARPAIIARFWEKVNKTDGCWLWTASVTGKTVQHGQFTFRVGSEQIHVYAHRFSFELVHGPIPGDLQICHTCDVARCVNPAHLFPGTQHDNLTDARRKGRLRHPRTWSKVSAADVREIQRTYQPGVNGKILAARYGIRLTSLLRLIKKPVVDSYVFEQVATSQVEPVVSVGTDTLQVIDAGREGNQELHHLPEQGRRPEVIRHV